jgi:hypothetical protein
MPRCAICGETAQILYRGIPLCIECDAAADADTAAQVEPEIAETLPSADGIRRRAMGIPFGNIPQE